MRFHQGTRFRQRSGHVVVSIVAFVLATGCDLSSLAFVEDERVRIVEPENRSVVTLPVTLRWEVVGEFEVTGRDGHGRSDAGYFAVFVDRQPIPPGTTLEWYALQDDSCGESACGTVKNLTGVYTTNDTAIELSRLRANDRLRPVEQHEAVIVLLDGTGARIGEIAFHVRFHFKREA